MTRPIIGVTGRRFDLSLVAGMDARYHGRHTDSVPSDFARCVARAGGAPVLLPFEFASTDAVARLDGVVVTGGQDIHPRAWGGDLAVVRDVDPRGNTSVHDEERDLSELAIVRRCIDIGIPILGVCRGHQILNVALGGTLIEDLPRTSVAHQSSLAAPTDGEGDHLVTFEPGTTAYAIYGPVRQTNSWHHQAVDRCGAGLVVTGRTADNVVESIELPGRDVIGVQWHPEWALSIDPIFDWLVRRASKRLPIDHPRATELISSKLREGV